ncbi:MAG: adenine deaminase C-terminal domain-containing protein [Prevotellaceae bacterium]|nr:adenine deaminase C-terminal domain-containing protein [Prevotellaceae bacterium]MDO4931852.1 adenine deaminase C-terminal domain-containing protein [Prevotellaceae bacterium]
MSEMVYVREDGTVTTSCGNEQCMRPSLLLKGGTVVDSENAVMYSADVLVEDGRITAIGASIDVNDVDRVIDCSGLVVTAGFVDAHVHIESSMVMPQAFGEAVLPFGTTAVIADPHEVVNVAGAEGLRDFLTKARRAPVDVFTVVPSCVPATPYDTNGAGRFTAEQMCEFTDIPEIVGLGEVMSYGDVVAEKPDMMAKLALFKGKTIDGHTAGIEPDMVGMYAAHGISNDHECYDEEGMLRCYNSGMNIYIREGSAARNARTLLSCARRNGLDVARMAFCTDDKHLATIAKEGHISYIVRMALQEGFTWGEVARMAACNPCHYYSLKERGNVRKGYVADIVVTDYDCNKIHYVLKDGMPADEKIASMERKTVGIMDNTVRFRKMYAADFIVPEEQRNVAMGLVPGELLTESVGLNAGEWRQHNVLATVERHGKNGNVALCPLVGYGIKDGAVATSVSHDSHNVVCAGDNPADMALACNRLREIGGGYVIASKGYVIGEFSLPYYGLMSPMSVTEAAEAIAALERKAHTMGVQHGIDPFITLSFVALPVIPRLRLLDTGLFDCGTGQFVYDKQWNTVLFN